MYRSNILKNEKISRKFGNLEILCGEDVLTLLHDSKFIEEWDYLYNSCPWGTIFQSSNFVKSWYVSYSNKYLPILVFSWNDGILTGILPLSDAFGKHTITGAGGYDAFYHSWLSLPEKGDEFINNAFKALCINFPGQDIYLKYIPPLAPSQWQKKYPEWRKLCVTRKFRRPLIDLNAPNIEKQLNKPEHRKKRNQLEKLGKLSFKDIECSEELISTLDELADQWDFRKAATFKVMPFRDDQTKKLFLIKLFKEGILKVCVLKVNEDIVGAEIAIFSKNKWAHSNYIMYAPTYSCYSPGNVITQLFGIYLKQAGFDFFDLTPGGHEYKERHANSGDIVIELRITNHVKALYLKAFYSLKGILKVQSTKLGINPRRLKLSLNNKIAVMVEQLKSFRFISLRLPTINYFKATKTTILKFSSLDQPHLQISKNSLKDLLSYSPNGSTISKWKFLNKAMQYYERGFIPYSYCEADKLMCLIWQLNLNRNRKPKECEKIMELLDDSNLYMYIYYHSDATNKIIPFLSAVTAEISNAETEKTIYIVNSELLSSFNFLKCFTEIVILK